MNDFGGLMVGLAEKSREKGMGADVFEIRVESEGVEWRRRLKFNSSWRPRDRTLGLCSVARPFETRVQNFKILIRSVARRKDARSSGPLKSRSRIFKN